MRKLIVTADDFGAALQVNQAVERAYRDGILSAASLMVAGVAAQDAVARAKTMPGLRVGLHLVLIEGRPVLPAAAIPLLVDSRGNFRSDMARAGAAIFFRPAVRHQLQEEIAAQFEAFRATGLGLDHINAHKHFHLHPTVGAMIVKFARSFGVKAARVPLEPQAVLCRIEPPHRCATAALTRPFAQRLRRNFVRAGLAVPDQVFGLAWSGAMTGCRLTGLVQNLPSGLSEIYMHPATGPYPGSAPGYRYREELEALTDFRLLDLVAAKGIKMGGFCDFIS